MGNTAAINLLGLANSLGSGELALMDYLAQLESDFDQIEPRIRAFLPEEARFDRLRDQADRLLGQFPNPAERPPLFGVPVGVKDIFHVEGFTTRAGAQIPEVYLQGEEAVAVRLLKSAGALILGKTVTTEFAYFAPGPTRNPHHLDHTPGGSSSGSAAAVGAGICPLALGTQTIGSITRPASFCGVVAFKPSYDRISRVGVIPLSPSVDHIGFFAPDLPGAKVVAGQLCDDWQFMERSQKPVLGVPDGPLLDHADPDGREHFEATCDRLVTKGFTVRRVPAMPDFEYIRTSHNRIVSAEAASVHRTWFEKFGELYHPKTAELIHAGQQIPRASLAKALNDPARLRRDLMSLMDQYGLDLWISPSAPGVAPEGLASTGDPVMNLPWTHSGLPTLNLPSGFNEDGLPYGLQVAGAWYQDEALLAWGAHLSEAL